MVLKAIAEEKAILAYRVSAARSERLDLLVNLARPVRQESGDRLASPARAA